MIYENLNVRNSDTKVFGISRPAFYNQKWIHPFRLVFEKKEGKNPNCKYFRDSRLLLVIAIKYRNEIIQLGDSL
mgnify:FL=1